MSLIIQHHPPPPPSDASKVMNAALCPSTTLASSCSNGPLTCERPSGRLRSRSERFDQQRWGSRRPPTGGAGGVDSSSVLVHPVTNRLQNVKKSQFPRAQSQFFQLERPKPPNDKNIWALWLRWRLENSAHHRNLLHSLLIYCHFNELISSALSSR